MPLSPSAPAQGPRARILAVLTGPPVLAFLPALTLGAYWLAGEPALLLTSLGIPLVFAFSGALDRHSPAAHTGRDRVTGLMLRDEFDAVVAATHEATGQTGLKSALFLLDIDDFREFAQRHGADAADAAALATAERISSAVRDGDAVARMGDGRFAICLKPVRQLDLELCIQLAGRLQTAVEETIALGGASLYLSCSVGFCLRSRAPDGDAAAWLDAAAISLEDAQLTGPSGIRAFSPETQTRSRTRHDLRAAAADALDNGQIQPWYQPQISTDTGRITGFEALARWSHPVHGLVSPDTFLPAIEEAGLAERLGEVILYHAFTALKAWDSAGIRVPRVGINFSGTELRNPALVDKIGWELDRFDLTPDRLTIEILETVVSDTPDDVICRNIAGLGALGCGIDLDDFGTGHASIASIRRFPVSRIKIDRSFVMKADRDPEQQRLIGAILTMAERLDLETLAEGVETVGEHALLAQLGCTHVQGFGIGRPMPFDQTLDWIAAHEAKLQDAPPIRRETG